MKSDLTESTVHLLSVVANPTRKAILESLDSQGPINFTQLMQKCGMEVPSQCGVFSFHLRKLLAVNLIDQIDNVYFITYFGRKVVSLLKNFEREVETTFSNLKIWTEVISAKMKIRKLSLEEREKYAELLLKIFGKSREDLVNQAFLKGNYVLVAETEDGGFMGFLHFYMMKAKEGHICDMGILKEYRSEGIEDALVEQGLEMMKALNYLSATAYVIPYMDEEKLRFWNSKSFQEVSFSFAICNGSNFLEKATKLYASMKEEKALSEPEVWFWLQRSLKEVKAEPLFGLTLRRFREDDIDEIEMNFKTEIPKRLFSDFEYAQLESNKLARETWLKFSYVAIKDERIIGYCIALQDQERSVAVMHPKVLPAYQDIALEVKNALLNQVVRASRNMKLNYLACRVIKYPLTADLLTPQVKEWIGLGFQPTRILFDVEVQETKGFYDAFKRTLQQINSLGLDLCPEYQIDFAVEREL